MAPTHGSRSHKPKELTEVNSLEKLWRADASRRSRFHTASGTLCLNPIDLAYALATATRRRITGVLPELPWIPLPALRYIQRRVRNAVVFEYSMGMSTLWYSRHAAKVYAVEHDESWYEKTRLVLKETSNTNTMLARDRESYINAVANTDEVGFDIVSVDGIHRLECARRSVEFLNPFGMLVVDNTDAPEHRGVAEFLLEEFGPAGIRVFAGYPPASVHPNETTICVRES